MNVREGSSLGAVLLGGELGCAPRQFVSPAAKPDVPGVLTACYTFANLIDIKMVSQVVSGLTPHRAGQSHFPRLWAQRQALLPATGLVVHVIILFFSLVSRFCIGQWGFSVYVPVVSCSLPYVS